MKKKGKRINLKNMTKTKVEGQKESKKLEEMVVERTRVLEKKIRDLEALNGIMVERELKMIELKKEIKELKKQLNT